MDPRHGLSHRSASCSWGRVMIAGLKGEEVGILMRCHIIEKAVKNFGID